MSRSALTKLAKKFAPLSKSAAGGSISLKERLIRDFTGSFGLRVASIALGFLTSIVLARLLGKVGFGVYTYALTWPVLLGFLATLGLDHLLVREIAIYRSQSAWGLIRGLLQWANASVLVVSTGIALGAIAISFSLEKTSGGQMLPALCVAFISLPIVSLTRLRLSAMMGLHRVVLGQMPEALLAPLLLLVLTVSASWWLKDQENAAVWVVGLQVVAAIITFVVGILLLAQVLPQEVKQATPQYMFKTWLWEGLPFMLLEGLSIINFRIDILMLGFLADAGAVGIYAIVNKVTSFIIFAWGIVNIVIMPTLATLYAEGKREQLQKLVTHTTRLTTLFALAIMSILIGGRYWILLLFGTEFTQGQTTLIIVSIGYLVIGMVGPVGYLLNMTKYAHFNVATIGFGALLNVCLNFLLIPKWGINGAATATATSTIIVCIVSAILVRHKIGIKSTLI
jgi:O-antigen/teichoic acid export membrane protein